MSKHTHPTQVLQSSTSDLISNPPCRLVLLIRVIWLMFWLCLATFLVFLPISIGSFFSRTGNFAFHVSRMWARIILMVTRVRVRVSGGEKIDRNRSYVIIANHQSHFDGPALALGLGTQFRWIAKQELQRIPLFGHALTSAGCIFIDRSSGNAAVESIKRGVRNLASGVSVMCFAEGTRSQNGRMGAFKKGGFVAAVDRGLPILPVTITGSAQVLPRGRMTYSPGTIQLTVGDPIDTSGYSLEQIDGLIQRTRDAVMNPYAADAAD